MCRPLTFCLSLRRSIRNSVSSPSLPEFWWHSLLFFQRHRDVLGGGEDEVGFNELKNSADAFNAHPACYEARVTHREAEMNFERKRDKKSGMSLKGELPLLKARAQAVLERLDVLNRRIGEIRYRSEIPLYIAVTDTERCLGCGVCETVCPVGAIAIKNTAAVDPARCIGCGRCEDECPQGAIELRSSMLTH